MKIISSRDSRRPSLLVRRELVVTAFSLGLASMLAGCGGSADAPDGGQSRQTALDTLGDDGFTSIELYVSSAQNGFQSTKTTDVFVGLPDGAVINDQAAVLDYLLRTAWSVSDDEPNRSITADFTGELEDIDWVAVGTNAGLPLSDRMSSPTMSVEDAAKTFGPWPGDVPALPSDVITLP